MDPKTGKKLLTDNPYFKPCTDEEARAHAARSSLYHTPVSHKAPRHQPVILIPETVTRFCLKASAGNCVRNAFNMHGKVFRSLTRPPPFPLDMGTSVPRAISICIAKLSAPRSTLASCSSVETWAMNTAGSHRPTSKCDDGQSPITVRLGLVFARGGTSTLQDRKPTVATFHAIGISPGDIVFIAGSHVRKAEALSDSVTMGVTLTKKHKQT